MHAGGETSWIDWLYLFFFALVMGGLIILFRVGFRKIDDSGEEEEEEEIAGENGAPNRSGQESRISDRPDQKGSSSAEQ
jgi:hypothetical protein